MLRVSRVIAEAGLVDTTWFTETARTRGTIVHALAEAAFQRQQGSVAPSLAGFAFALSAGIAALGFEAVCVERRFAHNGITGRPDAIGFVTRPVGSGIHAGPMIVDVKSGEQNDAHGIQLALYEMLANANNVHALLPVVYRDVPWNRVGLYVAENGRYRIHTYTDPMDHVVAAAALDLARWRLAHGLLSVIDDPPDDPAFPMMEAS